MRSLSCGRGRLRPPYAGEVAGAGADADVTAGAGASGAAFAGSGAEAAEAATFADAFERRGLSGRDERRERSV